MDLFMVCFWVESEIGFSVCIHRISWKTTQFNQLICVRNEKKRCAHQKKRLLRRATEYRIQNNNSVEQTIEESPNHKYTIANASHINLNALSCTVRLKVWLFLCSLCHVTFPCRNIVWGNWNHRDGINPFSVWCLAIRLNLRRKSRTVECFADGHCVYQFQYRQPMNAEQWLKLKF